MKNILCFLGLLLATVGWSCESFAETVCAQDEYNAVNINGDVLEGLCCKKYEIGVLNENNEYVCKGFEKENNTLDLFSPHGSFYVWGQEIKCSEETEYPTPDESALSGYKCETCPRGHYCDGYKKTVCEAGKYADDAGQISCNLCEEGHFCPGEITKIQIGTETVYINAKGEDISYAGEIVFDTDTKLYSGSGEQIECPQGYYTNKTQRSTCLKCTSGTSNMGTGNTDCELSVYKDLNFRYGDDGDQTTFWTWPSNVTQRNVLYDSVSGK